MMKDCAFQLESGTGPACSPLLLLSHFVLDGFVSAIKLARQTGWKRKSENGLFTVDIFLCVEKSDGIDKKAVRTIEFNRVSG